MDGIEVIATVHARADSAAQVAALLAELAVATRGEEGCLQYQVYRADEEPGLFHTLERWRSAGHADAHLATAHVARAIRLAGPLLASPLQIRRVSPLTP